MCCFLPFQAKEVRRKADQMVQLGKDVRPLAVYQYSLMSSLVSEVLTSDDILDCLVEPV